MVKGKSASSSTKSTTQKPSSTPSKPTFGGQNSYTGRPNLSTGGGVTFGTLQPK